MTEAPPRSEDTSTRGGELLARWERLPFTSAHRRAFQILGTGTFFDSFDTVALAVTLTAVTSTMHIGLGDAGLLISAGYVGQIAGALGLGWASERYGRRPVFLASMALFGVAALLAAAAWSGLSLGLFRLVQGIGLGAEVPVAAALFNELVRGRARGRSVMLYETSFTLGNMAASLVAAALFGLLHDEATWRTMLALGAIPLLVALWARPRLVESPRFLISRGRTAEAGRLVTAMEAETLRKGNQLEPAEAPIAPDTRATRLAEIFSAQYLRRTMMIWTVWFTTYFTLWGLTTWLPSLLVNEGGMHPATASLASAGLQAINVALVVTIALTVDRLGRRFWITLGYAVSALGAAIGALVTWSGQTQSPVGLIALAVPVLLGVNAVAPIAFMYTGELYPTRMRAWGTMAASSFRNVGAVLAPAVIGWILDGDGGMAALYLMFLTTLVVGLAVFWAFGPETAREKLESLAS
ncbi:MFS transporter [Streptomyces sp. BA2]|uniref:MFS transporter n=1 Tax=Streptomyces sp. BA2 TaxID=436595 RepID=UPI00136C3A85|nr:MFS transporter [Streptomyces sp. BA2]